VCCSVLQCVAVCCSVLQYDAVCCKCVAVSCGVLKCVVVCFSVLQCVAVCCSVLQNELSSGEEVLQYIVVAVYRSVRPVCCSVEAELLQCVVVWGQSCCSVS